ncbi:MAG: glycosyltransferase family 2 protein [Candidatus Altiarchaeota archaeon]|nr:glycosyltransferase family 2 protein [Candidatus Altiarchaeota archaeon]
MIWLATIFTVIAFINLFTAVASFRTEKIPKLRKYPGVTIICRTWDDDHVVGRFIEGCLNQDYKGDIQIIIADDASTDKTGDVVKKYKGKIDYIRAKKHHKWKALFLNPIIETKVKGEILINTDIDAVLPKNYVTKMVTHLQKYDAVSSVCIGGNPDTLIAKSRIVEDIWLYGTGMKGRHTLTGKAAMYGGSHAIWMHALKKVGYYGEKTMTEDAELTVTLNKMGYKTGFCDDMVVMLEDVDSISHYMNERKRWLYGPYKIGKEYGAKHVLQGYNLLFGINMLLSAVSLNSLILLFFDSNFVAPFLISLITQVISLIRYRANLEVYLWIFPYIVIDPLIEGLTILGIIFDVLFRGGVKWIKVSGKKYHVGSPLRPVYRT